MQDFINFINLDIVLMSNTCFFFLHNLAGWLIVVMDNSFVSSSALS